MHPNTVRFIEAYDHEAALSGTYPSKLDKSALVFLEQVRGSAFDYNYEGLRALVDELSRTEEDNHLFFFMHILTLHQMQLFRCG
ncbi:hypothetical protein [Paenibacillus prosopidis]|uniref:Uncharacterized protein n=1 Tax=Paenibacillus prosopidis TaxID=630520 RepID=A0A368W9Z7_9BACL|nr:hypothetical protein [Paenibacillus prosopidis]RCW51906.1 hypothetical protein DFP97_101251 [Paenibacillus prosopidis]